ncbi:hypothetical protein GN958_ATG17757 [Phytophthora infestans]|uniref:Uncharacterized protein n=1 Tax=Phytophthora infestans TaxID=4787 RepID=A0A8S9TW99_PHYIN|nr:hypothetical protein GN958_ATG17757 [Phytophthora infestans]
MTLSSASHAAATPLDSAPKGGATPSLYELATTLPNICFSDFKVMMLHKLKCKKCTFSTDG